MTGNEPPEDPSEAPTGLYDLSDKKQGSPERSAPWYRRPIISLTVALFVAILIGIALYFLADQTRGTGGTKQTPTSPTISTSLPISSSTPTTTAPAAPPETSPGTTAPATTPASDAPTTSTTVEGGHHHHHHHDGGTP